MPKPRFVLSTAFALFAIFATTVPAAAAGPAHRSSGGSWQQVLINQDRAAAHKHGLAYSNCLASYAHAQAAAIASRGSLFHSNVMRLVRCRLGSRYVGENVGMLNTGGTYFSQSQRESYINTAFMNSAHHRENILGPYRYVGTAWVRNGNGWFVAVEFG